ncbi:MAG TPA: metallophosphoesterase [Ignavibacteria bacterium]|nr:metallophosphoesterase [Ignavibacteria bacterium]
MTIWNRIIFFTIVFGIFFGLQYLVCRTFKNFVRSKYPDSKFLKNLAVYPFLIFNLPFIYIIANGFSSANIPETIYTYVFLPFYIFQGAVIFIGLFLLIGKILKAPFSFSYWILNKFESVNKFFNKPEIKKIDYSRRKFIRGTTALVSGYAFTGATLGVLSSHDFEIVNKEIKIDNLPEELSGTTISLISDIHSGPYMKENMMREYTDVINDLKSDFIFIPGDFTNSNKLEVHPLVKAISNLKADKGIYGTLGNHDYFSDPEYVAKVISNESPVKMLRNNSELININGKNISIIGCDDTRQSGSNSDNILLNYYDSTMDQARDQIEKSGLTYEEVPKLLLFHKPYFFEEMAGKKPDLILSGHTHGGQVVLASFGDLNISFAGAVSKYISGLYRSGNSQMYISRGIGSVALPIRFNCPPEITKITLV